MEHLFETYPELRQDLISFLSGFLSEERVTLFNKVLNSRTRYITVVLEDIYQSQNASAVLRTCECLGVQDVHIYENRNTFSLNPQVVKGASKWLNIQKYSSTHQPIEEVIANLRSTGYRIIATSPHINEVSATNIDLEKGKMAFFFGNEHNGLSSAVLNAADEFVTIPMVGFTESFNISVSAGIILNTLITRLNQTETNYKLSTNERNEVMYHWLSLAVKRCDLIKKRYLKERNYI
ncbi:MAG: RNA methyltransferase [Bacteroidales bacterium]|nr:RNA methyltransferase [Bacteroidales bacterium]MBN2748595.1 RNA methyltransferase [Bacteroidales bacterium]